MEYFWLILIGIAAGWLAEQFMTREGFGLIGDSIIGVIGALIGGVFIEKTGIFAGSGFSGSMVVATIGAFVFLYGVRLVKNV